MGYQLIQCLVLAVIPRILLLARIVSRAGCAKCGLSLQMELRDLSVRPRETVELIEIPFWSRLVLSCVDPFPTKQTMNLMGTVISKQIGAPLLDMYPAPLK